MAATEEDIMVMAELVRPVSPRASEILSCTKASKGHI
jgi:hypothetical protein